MPSEIVAAKQSGNEHRSIAFIFHSVERCWSCLTGELSIIPSEPRSDLRCIHSSITSALTLQPNTRQTHVIDKLASNSIIRKCQIDPNGFASFCIVSTSGHPFAMDNEVFIWTTLK